MQTARPYGVVDVVLVGADVVGDAVVVLVGVVDEVVVGVVDVAVGLVVDVDVDGLVDVVDVVVVDDVVVVVVVLLVVVLDRFDFFVLLELDGADADGGLFAWLGGVAWP